MRTYTDVIQRLGLAAYYSYMNGIEDPVEKNLGRVIEGCLLVFGEGYTYGGVYTDVNNEMRSLVKKSQDQGIQRLVPSSPTRFPVM